MLYLPTIEELLNSSRIPENAAIHIYLITAFKITAPYQRIHYTP